MGLDFGVQVCFLEGCLRFGESDSWRWIMMMRAMPALVKDSEIA